MTIDLERLAVDADYWDKVAPEGATHFMHTEKFVKWVFGVEWVFYASSGREWKKTHCNWMLKQYLNDGTFVLAKADVPKPHPTDTQDEESGAQISAEWDGVGQPPIGCEVEVIDSECLMYGQGESGRVVAHVQNTSVVRMSYGLGCFTAEYLRPIRSQAERERKELATFLEDYHIEMGSFWTPEKEAEYILSSYDVANKARGES
jgi:hypothetical protein